MNIVDLSERTSGVSTKYAGVPQPMVSYTSSEEFYTNILNDGACQPILIKNMIEFSDFLKKNDYIGKNKFIDVISKNVWLATGEIYVPDSWTPDDNIIWKLKEMKLIKTDNCYIRLYRFYSGNKGFLLFTSSGIYNVSLTNWTLSAAIKMTFDSVSGAKKRPRTEESYKESLNKILTRKQYVANDMRLFNLIFNPYSDYYFKGEEAVLKVYGNRIKKEDRAKHLTSERFLALIKQELLKMIPDLKDAIQKQLPPTKIAQFLENIFNKALDKSGTDDQLKSLDAILKLGYSGEIVNDNRTAQGDVTILPDAKKSIIGGDVKKELTETSLQSSTNTPLYDDYDLSTKDGQRKFDAMKEETGTLNAYINGQ